MTTLRIEISSYPSDREDLGVFNSDLEISYLPDAGIIDDAWIVERKAEPIGGYTDWYFQVDPHVAWRLLGGKSETVREYLDEKWMEGAAE